MKSEDRSRLKEKEQELKSYFKNYLVDIINVTTTGLKENVTVSDLRQITKKIEDTLFSFNNTVNSFERITNKLGENKEKKSYYIPGDNSGY